MKKFHEMNRTLRGFFLLILLAVCTAVSFFALDYQTIRANGYWNMDDFFDDFSIEFNGAGVSLGSGSTGRS